MLLLEVAMVRDVRVGREDLTLETANALLKGNANSPFL